MKRNTLSLFITLVLLFVFAPACFADDSNQLASIKQNYKMMLLGADPSEKALLDLLFAMPPESTFSDQMIVELMERYPITEDRINELLSNIQDDGSWSDIDYTNQDRSGWKPKMHMERILELTKAYVNEQSVFYQSQVLESVIHKTLNYWFDNNFISLNWWHNQIGVPKLLGAVLILFEDRLTKDEIESGLKLMGNAKIGMTGQNKVWLSGNVLVRGLLQKDIELVKVARDSIVSEIRNDRLEGIKIDNSFHQHGAQQQFGNYGAAYIASMSFWGRIFNATPLSFGQTHLDILSSLINEGYSRILWKGYMDVGGLGRQFFHQAQRHKAFSIAFATNALAQVDNLNRDTYQQILDENFFALDKAKLNMGMYHFWKSDQTTYRQPQWMASVKMASSRVIGAESGNGDNLKGYYLADGATYFYIDGSEYHNIFPCWDWRKIPGITSYDTSQPLKSLSWSSYQNKSDFVGSVSDGTSGFTVMDFDRDGLKARKSWLFTQDFVLALGAGISTDSVLPVTTSVDQRLARGDLFQLDNNDDWKEIQSSEMSKTPVSRFFHDQTGYILLNPQAAYAGIANITGKWSDVMSIYPSDFIETQKVLSLYIKHDAAVKDGSYEYLVLPASTKDQVKQFDLNDVQVIKNTADIQAIYSPKMNAYYLACYKPSVTIKLSDLLKIKTHDPALFMIKKEEDKYFLFVSDPTQKLDQVNIDVNGRLTTVSLPIGEMRGTTVIKELEF